MLPLLRGYEEGPLTVTPEVTAIELLGVWLCRVENCRLDGRVNEDQCAVDCVYCAVYWHWMPRVRFEHANWPRGGEP